MPDYLFPANAELKEIEQIKLPRLVADRLIFRIMPMVTVDAHLLMWEQEDNWQGLQNARGLNGQPTRVKKVGAKRYQMEPGVYGEFEVLNEQELTTRRAYGTFGQPVRVDDLVMRAQDKLLQRRLDRIENIGWTLLTTGTFSVSDPAGVLQHTDTFSLQTFSAGTAWSTAATSTPLADLRAVQLLSRGYSVNFGAQAMAVMNRTTWNNFIKNTNAADFGGKKGVGLQSISSVADANRVLAGEDLPQLMVYDEGYIDEAGAFQLYIPNGKVVIVGQRPGGTPIADYAMTRNANNPEMAPGPYVQTVVEQRPPRSIEVHDGHNGGPRIYYPSAIVIMSV